MKKRNIIIIIAVIAVVAVTVATRLSGLTGGEETAVVSKDVVVDTLTPDYGDIAVEGEYIGSLSYDESVYVFPKTSGMVTATYFQPGDTVRKGDVLFEIDTDSLTTQVAQSEAAYRTAVAGEHQTVTQLESALAAAEIMKDDAEANLGRMRQLYDAESISEVQMNQAQSAYDSALLQYETAKSNYDLIAGGGNGESRSVATAQVDQAREGLKAAEKQLSYSKVTAPMDGVVDRKLINVYDTATTQSYAYVITNHDGMRVVFRVPEQGVEALSEGDSVTVFWNDKSCEGRIVELASAIDPASGLFDVKAVIDGADGLYAGSSVKVRATSRQAKNVLLIPLDCLYYEDGVPYVYLLKEGKALKVKVEVGVFNEKTAEIISGISVSDRVISTWHPNLADGTSVKTNAEAGK